LPVTGTSAGIGASTSAANSTKKIAELVKAMEEMSIQATELKKLREKVSNFETDCKLA